MCFAYKYRRIEVIFILFRSRMFALLLISVLVGPLLANSARWNPLQGTSSLMTPAVQPFGRSSPHFDGLIPFPQCLRTGEAAALLQPDFIQNLFFSNLQKEEAKLKKERSLNNNFQNSKWDKLIPIWNESLSLDDIMDFEAAQLRADNLNGALLARAATRASEELVNR
jgi:hypothetical protein